MLPRRRRRLGLHWVALTIAVLAFAGCGGGGGEDGSSTTRSETSEKSGYGKPGANTAPATSPSADRARAAGRRACRGQTPAEVAYRYRAIARRPGERRRFAALVVDPTPAIEESPGYPRLVAAFYATTVPAPVRAQAAAGCAEELAAASHGR
jgi:hypothetical protein